MANTMSPHLQNLLDRQNQLCGYADLEEKMSVERVSEEHTNQTDPMRLQRNQNAIEERQERQLEQYKQRVNSRQFHMERSYQRIRSRV